jgi:hypothetical protein
MMGGKSGAANTGDARSPTIPGAFTECNKPAPTPDGQKNRERARQTGKTQLRFQSVLVINLGPAGAGPAAVRCAGRPGRHQTP